MLIPVVFFAAFALGYAEYAVFGYAPEDDDVPVWLDVVVSVLSVALVALPCAAAAVFGRRAGGRRGLVPAVFGVLAGVGVTVLTVVTFVDAHVG